ncbi:MAG: diacylglycerol/lipid kinase family protein [bacterium]|jgi:diacylglycerol kinase (ATP)
MKVKYIVNPAAGRGKGKRVWRQVEKFLIQEGYRYNVAVTTKSGEATELAAQAAADAYEVVVAVGGDGTINEVANGIIGKDVALGIIPAGTGSDYVRTMAIPANPFDAARAIYTGNRVLVDVGYANGRYFLGVVGVGFDAEVCHIVNNKIPLLFGKAAYVAGVLMALAKFGPKWVRIDMDDMVVEEKVYLVAVANARYFGGGMLLAPHARIEDGLLDLCIIKDVSKLELLRVFPRVFTGEHLNHKAFQTIRVKQVSISGPQDWPIQAEGEIIGNLPLMVSVLSGALSVIIPAI